MLHLVTNCYPHPLTRDVTNREDGEGAGVGFFLNLGNDVYYTVKLHRNFKHTHVNMLKSNLIYLHICDRVSVSHSCSFSIWNIWINWFVSIFSRTPFYHYLHTDVNTGIDDFFLQNVLRTIQYPLTLLVIFFCCIIAWFVGRHKLWKIIASSSKHAEK